MRFKSVYVNLVFEIQVELAEMSFKNTKYFLPPLLCRFRLWFGFCMFKEKTGQYLRVVKSQAQAVSNLQWT